jgi:hypothetical protein
MEKNPLKLIHAACIQPQGSQLPRFLFLRKKDEHTFAWFEEMPNNNEVETSIAASNIEEAIRLATLQWKKDSFRTIICGFRYTLPERDEHGINALLHQMAASYSTINGVYYDEELGNNCFVQNASSEARSLWQRLKNEKRL